MSDDPTKVTAEARLRQYGTEYSSDHLTWEDFIGEAEEVTAALTPLIEERVREARAEAWDEGHDIGALDQVNLACFNIMPTPNPYRKDETDE